MGPEAAEDRFFNALLAGDASELEQCISADFVIVDVLSGALTDRTSFLETFRLELLNFSRLEVVERFTRVHGAVAIIVGRTEMAGAFVGAGFSAASRYTHVFVLDRGGQWLLETAQGTKITDA